MTVQTDELHFEIAGGKWPDAADRCNGLAMFDILPTIFGLSMGERSLLANNGVAALSQRGWTGSAERLRWACEIVVSGLAPSWTPTGLPQDQIGDASAFLTRGAGRIIHLAGLMSAGRLMLPASDARIVNALAADGKPHERPSEGLLEMLFALTDARPTRSISVFRPGQGPHGVSDHGLFVSRAIDISQFGAAPITLSPPSAAITVVADILSRLPAGKYKVGFPRPVGGPTGFDPAHDVFFPVPDLETASRCFAGTIALPLSSMLSPAREAVTSAIPAGVTFDAIFPDGLNHLHLEARSDTGPLPADT